MEIHINIIGTLLVLLSIIHLAFPRYFNWKKELQSLSLINRQIMQVHTFFIAFVVFLMGLLCLTSDQELINTPFGNTICIGLGVFWFVRLFFQLFIYSSTLWKGKTLETFIHILFVSLWLYIAGVFLLIGV